MVVAVVVAKQAAAVCFLLLCSISRCHDLCGVLGTSGTVYAMLLSCSSCLGDSCGGMKTMNPLLLLLLSCVPCRQSARVLA